MLGKPVRPSKDVADIGSCARGADGAEPQLKRRLCSMLCAGARPLVADMRNPPLHAAPSSLVAGLPRAASGTDRVRRVQISWG